MIINLSNHTSKDWAEDQAAAAREQFNTIVDMPFPEVDPDWEISTVYNLATIYAKDCLQILEKSPDPHNAIHVMGELTFCYQFVRLMQQQEVVCLASTTERIAALTADGKVSRFVFKTFRPYF
ncbi:MAG: CRISPR-associated protein [Bacteroidales bacterium]|jgi:hypothetical protein|nr:CRISPR-associated protein [Bacteroidales bacterium]